MNRAYLFPIGGAVLAPLITWWPMLAQQYPRLGLPQYPAAQGIDLWNAQTFWLVAFCVIAGMLWASDAWLALAVGLAGLTLFFRGAALDPTHAALFALGALMLLAMRQTPAAWHGRIKGALVAIGAFQCVYMLQQWAGYDLLWGPLVGGQLLPKLQPLGTLGTVDAASALLAITAPLMPLWCLPFIVAVVWYAHSLGAFLALATGLLVMTLLRFRGHAKPIAIAAAAVGAPVLYLFMQTKSLTTILGRVAIWGFGAKDWITHEPIVGYGLGGWAQRIPSLQVQQQFAPTGELWREAHNEPLQWVCETGLIGLILLVGWLWTHRAMFEHRLVGPSLAALGVNALSFFPLHVVPLALIAVVMVGLATSPNQLDQPDSISLSALPEWGAEP